MLTSINKNNKDYKMRKKTGFTLIDLIIYVVIMGLGFYFIRGIWFSTPKTTSEWENQENENLKHELIAFSKEKIPELYSAINESHRMREEIRAKKDNLTMVLKKLGKDYRNDEDIKKYDELLHKLDLSDIEYDKMLREGYLQYKKFEISSHPAYEKMLENYNNKAKSLSESIESFIRMHNIGYLK